MSPTTSPILNLARIGRLDLLRSLYHTVFIPPAVCRELTRPDIGPPLIDSDSSLWLPVVPAEDQTRVEQLSGELDPGEAEAIVLALEREADLLLVDERRARGAAAARGLQITGLLGVLAAAKQAGLIESVKPVLDDLMARAHFWIGTDLYEDVLRELGEA